MTTTEHDQPSPQQPIKETENVNASLERVLSELSPENLYSLASAYEGTVRITPRNVLFDLKNPNEREQFDNTRDKLLEIQADPNSDTLVGYVSITEEDKNRPWQEFYIKLLDGFDIAPSDIVRGNVVGTIFETAGERDIALIAKNIHLLPEDMSRKMVFTLDQFQKRAAENKEQPRQVTTIASANADEIYNQKLRNQYMNPEEEEASMTYDSSHVDNLRETFYQAFESLRDELSVSVELPPKSGASSFRKTLQSVAPEAILSINMSACFSEDGAFDIDQVPLNVDQRIAIVDHSHLIPDDPEIYEQILAKTGKTLFIHPSDN